jgi:hypothetical protein
VAPDDVPVRVAEERTAPEAVELLDRVHEHKSSCSAEISAPICVYKKLFLFAP